MKLVQRSYLLFLLAGINFISCKKELSCENCQGQNPATTPPSQGGNRPPQSKAGADIVTVMPKDSVLLDGSSSSDPDGSIVNYKWTRISGASTALIKNPASAQTIVKNLSVGSYQFELMVTDNGGLTAKDTLNVVVNNIAPPLNQPPVANAGQNLALSYNLQTCSLIGNVTLDATGSYDPDGSIVSYVWICANNQQVHITDPNSPTTTVTGVGGGFYEFKVIVTDDMGAVDEATVTVTVQNINRPSITAQLEPIGTLSKARYGISSVSAGGKIVFAGGIVAANNAASQASSRVDIFDIASNSWTTAELSQARYYMAAAVLNGKMYFAGGYTDPSHVTSRIDIYDMYSNSWSTAELSQARGMIVPAVAGNKIFFAGGDIIYAATSRIDVLDGNTNSWSIKNMSEPKAGFAAATDGNRIFFAGGYSNGLIYEPGNEIDIYDVSTDTWSSSSLTESKRGLAGIVVNNKIFWAGGFTGQIANGISPSNKIEIKDLNSQSSIVTCLFQPNSWYINQSALVNNKIIFFVGESGNSVTNKFDIYDIVTNSFYVGELNTNMQENVVISVDNQVYVAGGKVNGTLSSQVFKLNF